MNKVNDNSLKLSLQYRDILRAAKRTKTALCPGSLRYCVVGVIVKDNYKQCDNPWSLVKRRYTLESSISQEDKAKLRLIENGFEGKLTFITSVWDNTTIESDMPNKKKLKYLQIGQKLRKHSLNSF